MKSFMGIEYDSSTLMKKMNQMDEDKRKVDEMYKVKHLLFDYIHLRIRTLKKSHKSQKLGWYKRRWGNEITQYYYDKETKEIKGDLDKMIGKLKDELTKVQNLSNKDFKTKFSHKKPKYKQRIQKDIKWERSDDNVKHYTSTPLRGIVKDLL